MTARRFRRNVLGPSLFVAVVVCLMSPLISCGGGNKSAAGAGPYGQPLDEEYTRLIKEATTSPEFQSPLTNYLPKVDGVPTPKDVLGRIAGAPGYLTSYDDILKYMNALAKALPSTVQVVPIGKTSEGRDMVQVIIADAATMSSLPKYKEMLAKLADPRVVKTEAEADAIIAQAKPVYWLTGNLHSGETGAAEKSMELAYRLAVDNNPMIKKIRENVISIITPSVEPDGHEKYTQFINKYNKDVTERDKLVASPYRGKYTQHDNNRDMIGISQPETQAEANTYFDWHMTIIKDNHESIPLLYVMSGTGPYNDTYDPSVKAEWNLTGWWDVTRLTSYGMPGVWTYGFWDGWTPNYLFSVANNHNSIGRFYETFGNGSGATMQRDAAEGYGNTEEWYRPNPQAKSLLWSMRDNNNYQMSGDIESFYFLALHKEDFLKNFWRRGLASYERGKTKAPFGYIIPAGQRDPNDVAYLVNILLKQRIEVGQSQAPLTAGGTTYPAGSYLIKMDQPYRDCVQNLLQIQKYPPTAPESHDDAGWTLGLLMDTQTVAVDDKSILDAAVTPVTAPVVVKGEVSGKAAGAYIINNATQNALLAARYKLKDYKALAAEAGFSADGKNFDAGSLIFPMTDAPAQIHDAMAGVASELGLNIATSAAMPTVKMHDIDVPRLAVLHTWANTQDDGWVRWALDAAGVPYAMINKDHLKKGSLKSSYDVIIFSNCRGATGSEIVTDLKAVRGPMAFVKSDEFPALGSPDSTEDIFGGFGEDGVKNLEQFVKDGGVLITLFNPTRVAVDYGFVKGFKLSEPTKAFYNPGSLLRSEVVNATSPIVYGYNSKEVTLFRRGSGPLISASPDMQKYVVLRYAKDGDVCLSGIVKSQDEIKGTVGVAAVPVGKGTVVMFGSHPMMRAITLGNYPLVYNAILNHNYLGGRTQ